MKATMTLLRLLLLPMTIVFLSASVTSEAFGGDLELASPFGNNMVLQRDAPITIWGWADAGQSVTVSMKNNSGTTEAADDGSWRIVLPPIAIGDPFEVTVRSNGNSKVLKNVVAGEVWICSGQSNMEWKVVDSADAENEIANGDHPMIRHLKIRNVTRLSPQTRVANSGWQVCSPETVENFSAVGYHFAKRLHKDLQVPIGLVNTTWGGTVIEAWIEGKVLGAHPDFAEVVRKLEAEAADTKKAARLAADAAAWQEELQAVLAGEPESYHPTDFDDSKWKTIPVPAYWEQKGYKAFDGAAWYRRQVELPENWLGKPLRLSLGTIDDIDMTYVNGQKIGETTGWNVERRYEVDAETNQSRTLSIAVRVTDSGGGGGMVGAEDDYSVSIDGEEPIALAGKWKMQLEPATKELGPAPSTDTGGYNTPTGLFNAMVNPLIPFKARGVIWYQGESNADRGRQYQTLFPMLINNWRDKWQDDMSFYWVQLANFRAPAAQPYDSDWAELREAQTMTLSLPKTGQAVIIDIGEAYDIHPKNKQDVGDRLARIALAKDYQKDVKYSGPMYRGMTVEGGQIRLGFDFSAGLTSSDGGPLKRFEIAGDDQKFYWADAEIDGNDVVVSAEEVASPVAVRYAWAENPEGRNLTNETGLPASPFRTDNWGE